jgi:drug/metabolite transporter (DMT)-like permease
MLGALLALASAATFGLNNAALRRGVLTGSVLHAMAITVPLGVPLFALACLPFGGFGALSAMPVPGWIWMAAAGVIHFVIGRYGNYRATRAIGATLSSPIQQLSVPVALVLALAFLDEVLTPLRLAGFVLVMIGPLVTLRNNSTRVQTSDERAFRPHHAEGIVWGSIAALGYGSSPLFIVLGLGDDRGLVESLAGGFVSYTAATMVIAALILFAGGLSFLRRFDRTSSKWFFASGVLVFLSQMFRYMALAVAPVTVVVPIQRLSVVFRVVFSWMLNRDHEIFGFHVLFGIGISLIGAIALTLSTDVVLSVLPMEIARWLTLEWP